MKALISFAASSFILICSLILLAPQEASAQSSCAYSQGCGTVVVYVQVNNQNSTTFRQPWDFMVFVTGQNPQPSSFAGNQNGTSVYLGSGYYNVSVQNLLGYTASYSGNCSGSMNPGNNLSCTVTLTGNSYYPGTLACAPTLQTVQAGQTATVVATGGSGSYQWLVDNQVYPGGSTLSATFYTGGSRTVSLSSGSQRVFCTINVTGGAYPGYPQYPNYPTYPQPVYPTYPTYPTYPRLPNTGFAPSTGAEIAFAVVLLGAAALALAPYGRKTLAALSR